MVSPVSMGDASRRDDSLHKYGTSLQPTYATLRELGTRMIRYLLKDLRESDSARLSLSNAWDEAARLTASLPLDVTYHQSK